MVSPIRMSFFILSYVFLFLYLHASRTYVGGEYHLCAGLSEFLELTKEAVKLHRTLKSNFHDHRKFSRHAAAFQNIWNPFRIVIEFLLILRKHIEVDERKDVISEFHRVDLCLVGRDDPIFLQFLN